MHRLAKVARCGRQFGSASNNKLTNQLSEGDFRLIALRSSAGRRLKLVTSSVVEIPPPPGPRDVSLHRSEGCCWSGHWPASQLKHHWLRPARLLQIARRLQRVKLVASEDLYQCDADHDDRQQQQQKKWQHELAHDSRSRVCLTRLLFVQEQRNRIMPSKCVPDSAPHRSCNKPTG